MRLKFTEGTFAERDALVKLRNLGSNDGVDECVRRGLVKFVNFQGALCWCILDQSDKAKQMRRLDGVQLTGQNGAVMKAKSVFGSQHSWPIGTLETKPYQYVALVEGGPDLLAAFQYAAIEDVIKKVAVCTMFGSSNRICDEALAELSGKRVRVIGHADKAGAKARVRWMEQLRKAGCEVDAYDLHGLKMEDGSLVDDINDLFSCDEESVEFLINNHLFAFAE